MNTLDLLPEEPKEPEKNTGPKLGVFDGISNEDYHRGPGVSKSGLDLIDQSPETYITHKRHPKPETPDLILGRAFHKIVLEPDDFDNEYVKAPKDAPKRPTQAQLDMVMPTEKAIMSIHFWKNWDQKNIGKTVLTDSPGNDPFWKPGQWQTLMNMRDAVWAHPMASILLDPSQGQAELSCYWIDPGTGKLCRCRPDFYNDAHRLLIDLKSTDDASYTGFQKSIGKWRYFVQHAFYLDGWLAAGQRAAGFIFIAVEKTPPYGVGIYKLDAQAVHQGRIIYERNLETYAKCHESKDWHGYSTDIRDLELPAWATKGFIS